MLLNCEHNGITHLVHIELALPSSQLSVAGRKIPNEVMAGRRNKRTETPARKKKYQVQITGQMFGTRWIFVTGNDRSLGEYF